MGASLNKVFLVGNLTRKPEVRKLPSGNAVTDLRMAMNRRYRTASGENREETTFVSVTVFGRDAENCGQYLDKGSPVLIDGRLKLDEWEKDGQKMSRLGVVADRVQFLSGGPRGGGGGRTEYDDAPAPRAAARAPAAAADAEPAEEPPADAAGAGGGDEDNLPF